MPIRTEKSNVLFTLSWGVCKQDGTWQCKRKTHPDGKKVILSDNDIIRCNQIEGTLGSVYTKEDSGNSENNVDPHIKLCITLFDDEFVHRISVRADANIGWSLASRISEVNRGDLVRINIRQGTKKKTVSFANIHKFDPEQEIWKECEYSLITADESLSDIKQKEEKTNKSIEIFNSHPAKSKFKNESS